MTRRLGLVTLMRCGLALATLIAPALARGAPAPQQEPPSHPPAAGAEPPARTEPGAPPPGQRPEDFAAQVQQAIQHTDERIDRAENMERRSPSPDSKPFLDDARLLQARAKQALAAHEPELAMRLTMRARGHAERSILTAQGLPDPDRVTAQLERTRDLLALASERLEGCPDARAQQQLQIATDMEQRAEDAARSERYLAALQLTLGARERTTRAMRQCNRGEDARDSAERALRRTDEILARAQGVVGGGPEQPPRDALARGLEAQAEARREFAGAHFERSLMLTQGARSLAYRAIRLSGDAI
jgi:hypothetical protein